MNAVIILPRSYGDSFALKEMTAAVGVKNSDICDLQTPIAVFLGKCL